MEWKKSMLEEKKRDLSYAHALREGLDQMMAVDNSVVVIGEGVPDPKGIFGTTLGLQNKYGSSRVFDMPLSENGITGVCIGASLNGIRPVMIHQRSDFALLAMDQIVNNAAKWHYIFDGKASVPIVIRMIMGRGWGQGPQHSQGLHGIFAQVPGLKVVMPTTPYDAKGMLIASIQDNNPVIFIEHRWLHPVTGNVPKDFYSVPLGKAKLLKEGNPDTLTIAAFSYSTLEALDAAKALSKNMHIELEVIDMRCVRPLDFQTVIDSVVKTGRLLVVDTAFESGGVSGELITQVIKNGFIHLKAAPQRICMPDYPVPTSPYMTEGYYPGPQEIADKALELMSKSKIGDAYCNLKKQLMRHGKHDVPHINFSGPF